MYQLQEKKTLASLPASFTNAATASLLIDTLNFDACSIDILLGPPNTATNVPAITILTADVTNASSFVNFTAQGQANYGSGTSNTTVTANGSFAFSSYYTSGQTATSATNNPDIITVDLALLPGKQRYLKVAVTPVTTQVVVIEANLYRGGIAPSTAPSKNCVLWVTL
jgi:hypothetical protein